MTVQSEKYTNYRVVKTLAITDTNTHDSSIADLSRYTIGTIYVNNTLDQAVDVQIYGNIVDSTVDAVTIGSAFTVATADQESRTISYNTAGWMPYIYISITASITPTTGSVTANILCKNPSSPK